MERIQQTFKPQHKSYRYTKVFSVLDRIPSNRSFLPNFLTSNFILVQKCSSGIETASVILLPILNFLLFIAYTESLPEYMYIREDIHLWSQILSLCWLDTDLLWRTHRVDGNGGPFSSSQTGFYVSCNLAHKHTYNNIISMDKRFQFCWFSMC